VESLLEHPFPPGLIRVVSTDMTTATDGLHQQAALAAWDGVSRGLGLSDEAKRIGRACYGPQSVEGGWQAPIGLVL
jgi:hypothetical protein